MNLKRIYLRAFDYMDIPARVGWMNDSDFREYLNSPYPVSEASTRQWLESILADSTKVDLIICLSEADKAIGYVGFRNIDLSNQKAESYMGIGDKGSQGKGYAKEACILSLHYIFERFPLNAIYLKCRLDNTRIIEMSKKVGFELDGIIRSDLYSHGKFRDMAYLTLLRDEFYSIHGGSE